MSTDGGGPKRPVLWGVLSVVSMALFWAVGFATRGASAWILPGFLLLTPASLGLGGVAVVGNTLRMGRSGRTRPLVVGLVAGVLGVLLALYTLWMFFTPADRYRDGG